MDDCSAPIIKLVAGGGTAECCNARAAVCCYLAAMDGRGCVGYVAFLIFAKGAKSTKCKCTSALSGACDLQSDVTSLRAVL